jgi:HSP20 family molecular chaperone IbpA
MFRKKCRSCGEKVERKFNYCPWCGGPLKVGEDRDDFGMLGRDDSRRIQEDMKLPFGMEKIMGSLVKQLEKQMGDMNFDEKNGFPKGIKIQIARRPTGQVVQKKMPRSKVVEVSEKENERRARLKKVEAKSRVKRLGDMIIYEIETPGLKKKEDVVITELATGLEIRAYSKDKCYMKVIPLKVEILNWKVDRERVMIELKA